MGRYCKVLIIDDEFITRQGIKHMLLWEQEGFQIVGEASNGQEGLEMIEQYQPDVVLADIVMPVLNGIDFSLILQERYPHIKLIILSSYDNFEYVRTTLLNGAVDYVLKPTLNPEILLQILKKAARDIPGLCLEQQDESVSVKIQLERYLMGYEVKLGEDLKQYFPYMNYRIMAVDMKKACKNNRHQMDQLQELFEERLCREGFENVQMVWLNAEILCCILNYIKKREKELLTAIQESADRAGKIVERLLFVVSNPFTELSGIREIYEKNVKPCLEQKFYFYDKSLIFQEECIFREIKRFDYEKYTDFLKQKQYTQALHFLKEYMKYLAEVQYDEYVSKNLLKNLLYNFLMEIEKYGVDIDSLRGQYFRGIDETDNIKSYQEFCNQQIFSYLLRIANEIESNSENDARIIKIKEYINAHYSEKLDLTDIAREFSFNYHYISSYFNQHIPEGFSGYLNTVRIEKSCSLLKETKMPISDISVSVGYADHGYYCRIFRKLMGQTPSQYRHDAESGEKNEKKM